MNFPEIVDLALPAEGVFHTLGETFSERRPIRSVRALTDAREARALPSGML